MYRDSRDPKVAQAGVEVKTGRKWRAEAAVLDAKSWLCQKDLVGVVAHGRAGLGMFPTPQYRERKGKEKRRQNQEEVRAAVEEGSSSRTLGLKQQGAWTRLEQAMDRSHLDKPMGGGATPHYLPDSGSVRCPG